MGFLGGSSHRLNVRLGRVKRLYPSTSFKEHIKDAYCVVSYSSGMSIDAVINGVPVIAVDEGNFAYNVGETKLKNIESLNLAPEPEVLQWLYNLAYCQWTPSEMEDGTCWRHLKPTLNRLVAENKNAGS